MAITVMVIVCVDIILYSTMSSLRVKLLTAVNRYKFSQYPLNASTFGVRFGEFESQYGLSGGIVNKGEVTNNSLSKKTNADSSNVTNSADCNSTLTRIRGHVIALEYTEQFSAATYKFAQLANISVHWNKGIVEPFILDSSLIGLPGSPNELRFGDLYNLSAVEEMLAKCFRTSASSVHFSHFEDFLASSTRKFVVLHIARHSSELVHGNTRKLSGNISNCTNAMASDMKKIEHRLNHLLEHDNTVKRRALAIHGREEYKFRSVQALCVDATNITAFPEDITNVLLQDGHHLSNSRLSVVIISWRYIGGGNTPRAWHYYNPHFHWDPMQCGILVFPHSSLVVKAAQEFFKSLKLSRPFIGIHVRVEILVNRMILKSAALKVKAEECLARFWPVVKALTLKYSVDSSNVVMFHDFHGKYGTNSCHDTKPCKTLGGAIINQIENLNISTVSYDPSLFGMPEHGGFASLVEKEFLSQADYLLTMGAGRFQLSITQRFLQQHSKDSFYSLCSEKYRNHLPNLKVKL